jgi:hypothetical protein
MSGYFDALLRSSGMAIDGRAPAATHLESNAFDVAGDPGTTATETRLPAETPSLRPSAVQHEARPAAPPHEIQAPLAQRAPVHPDGAPVPTRTTPDARVESPVTRAVRSDAPATPDLGARLVRAAVRWIADDTPGTGNTPRRDASPQTPSPLPTPQRDETRLVSAAPTPDGDPAPQIVTPAVVAAKTIVRETVVREPAQEVRDPAEPVRAGEPLHARAVPAAQDETVEISIGAIHVRVDAPAVQTVARPAVMPAASAPPVGAFPPRSALSRRALRRI